MKPQYEIKVRKEVTANEEYRHGPTQDWNPGVDSGYPSLLEEDWVEVRPKRKASPQGVRVNRQFLPGDGSFGEIIVTTVAEMVQLADLHKWEFADVYEYTSWENWAESWEEDDEDDPDFPVIVRRVTT